MPDYTKPADDDVKKKFGQVFDTALDPLRTVLERTWFRNILYYLGEQWLVWFENQGTFGRRYEFNMSIPTPVSNLVRDYVRSMKALTLNKRYISRIWPNSNNQDDKDASAMGEHVLRWMDSLRDGEVASIKELVELWRLLTGNGFARTFQDNDSGVYIRDDENKVIDTSNDIAVECLLPFNVLPDPLGVFMREKRYVGIKSLKPKEWIEDTFKVSINANEDLREVDYQRQLMTLVSNVSPWKGRGFEADMLNMSNDDLVVYKEIEYRPTREYPEGRYQAIASDEVLVNDTHLPIKVPQTGEWHYTVTHFPYNFTPGSFWATGGVDDIISPQNSVNEIDQALAVNRKSLARPYVLTPAAMSIKRLSARGQGLLHLQYDGKDAGGAKALIHQGVPYPSQVLEERKINKETSQEAAGDPKNVLRGQTPHSGASGVLVDILRETAEQSHSPDIMRYYGCWTRVDKKRLLLAQEVYKESKLIKIPGKGNEIMVKKFVGSDLRNNTDVRFELDSGLSTTNAGQNQYLLSLVEQGFWGLDITQKPHVQRELLKRMGLSSFPEEQNIHRERAEQENSALASGIGLKYVLLPNMPIPDPKTGGPILDPKTGGPMMLFPATYDPVFRLDPHALHILVVDTLIFSREFSELPEERQIMAIAHRDLHEAALTQQRQEEEERALELSAAATEAGTEVEEGTVPGQPEGQPGGPGAPKAAPKLEGTLPPAEVANRAGLPTI